ncbi:hypothetical protein LIER_43259 [Lithospermum erythrorhizon]|uniref:Uncharacterized protein n=1 Tax=Lithospermum erythrorhizon TaxID=34254 RepID=A0AAV3PQY1_LITER
MMKAYLWNGTSSSKYCPKISWKQATLSKDEGGLGLKGLHDWNRAGMANHVWNLSERKEALWVKWINTYREILRPYVKYQIGDATAVNCKFDNWSSNGIMVDILSPRSISMMNMGKTDIVADFLLKVRWPVGRRLTNDIQLCKGKARKSVVVEANLV